MALNRKSVIENKDITQMILDSDCDTHISKDETSPHESDS
jgi:hypothetical protein